MLGIILALTIDFSIFDSIQMPRDLDVNGTKIHTGFETRPSLDFPTFDIRIRPESKDWSPEFELIHSKSYATNPSPFSNLELSDGYNFLMLNVVKGDRWKFRTGFGIVAGHPDVMIDGKHYFKGGFSGYQFGGFSGQVSIQRIWKRKGVNFFSEIKGVVASGPMFEFGPYKAKIDHTALQWHWGVSKTF